MWSFKKWVYIRKYRKVQKSHLTNTLYPPPRFNKHIITFSLQLQKETKQQNLDQSPSGAAWLIPYAIHPPCILDVITIQIEIYPFYPCFCIFCIQIHNIHEYVYTQHILFLCFKFLNNSYNRILKSFLFLSTFFYSFLLFIVTAVYNFTHL